MGTYDQDMTAFSNPGPKSRKPRISGARLFSPAISAASNPAISETIEPQTICVSRKLVSAVNGLPCSIAA